MQPEVSIAQGAPNPQRAFYEYEADVYSITLANEPAFRHRRDLVRRILPRVPLDAILDVGCGDGALAEDLRVQTGARVVGMDLAWKRAHRAKARVSDLPTLQGSSYKLPIRDRAFAMATCTDLLEHLDDPALAMRELVRVSAQFVLVTVPYKIEIEKTLCPHCGDDYFLYGHQHSFGREGIEALARDAGARVVRFEHLIPMFECRRYKWCPPLKWLIKDHFKDTGTLGALIATS
ncbi:MAG: class I SAM-dependent methyltransferase [Planctomycetota bacterium]